MSQQQQQQGGGPSIVDDMETSAFVIGLLMSSLAVITYPFTRVNFGRDFFRFQAILGLVILWFYSGFTSPHDAIPCVVLTVAFTGMLIYHRVRHFIFGAGADQNSRYNGAPRACRDGRISESTAKLLVEPFVITCFALLIASLWSGSLGVFLLASAVAGIVEHVTYLHRQRQHIQEIRDAEIDQDILTDRFDRKFGSGI